MRLKIKALIACANSGTLVKIANAEWVPFPLRLRLRPIIKQVWDHLENYNALRLEVCQSHNGVLDEATNEYKFKPDVQEAFAADIKTLQETDVDIFGDLIDLESFGKEPPLSVADLIALEWLLVGAEE